MRRPNLRKNINLDIDFSKNEKKVIDALLFLKMARTASKIARQAELPRTTVMYILQKLEKRKVATRIAKKTKGGQRFIWRARSIVTQD